MLHFLKFCRKQEKKPNFCFSSHIK